MNFYHSIWLPFFVNLLADVLGSLLLQVSFWLLKTKSKQTKRKKKKKEQKTQQSGEIERSVHIWYDIGEKLETLGPKEFFFK